MRDVLQVEGLSNDAGAARPKPHRTLGLRLFDVWLYPILTNFSVFAISVYATYLTTHGADRGAGGKLIYGNLGTFFHSRGAWLVNKFTDLGMSKPQAEMGKMVFFSFADGTLIAPFVKLLEDRREPIAKSIDEYLGSKPADESVYAAEPKQSWASVIGGRLAVASIVVPTAVALDKTGLNDRLFSNPGQRFGAWVARHPNLAKRFGSLDLPGLFKTVFFEFFYTSICTAGLYFSSRFFAGWGHKAEPPQVDVPASIKPIITNGSAPVPAKARADRPSSVVREVVRNASPSFSTANSL